MKRFLIFLMILGFAVSSHATDFNDTDQMYGWNGSAQFFQTWLAHKTQLESELNFQIPLTAATQDEMEAGTEAAIRSMSPLRVAQAIAAQGGTDDQTASEVPITDAGGYFTSTNVEGALQEAGAATPISFGTGLSFSIGTLSLDANLVTWAGVTPSANGQNIVTLTYANMRAALDLEPGIDFNAYDVDIAAIAGTISGTTTINPGAVSSGVCSSAIDGSAATGMTTSKKLSWNFQGDVSSITGYNPAGDLGYLLVYPATDHVYTKFCNKSGSSITPGSITITWWAY